MDSVDQSLKFVIWERVNRNILLFKDPNKAFENTVGKGSNTGMSHFLVLQQCLVGFQRQIPMFELSDLSSANTLDLDGS